MNSFARSRRTSMAGGALPHCYSPKRSFSRSYIHMAFKSAKTGKSCRKPKTGSKRSHMYKDFHIFDRQPRLRHWLGTTVAQRKQGVVVRSSERQLTWGSQASSKQHIGVWGDPVFLKESTQDRVYVFATVRICHSSKEVARTALPSKHACRQLQETPMNGTIQKNRVAHSWLRGCE